jgi:polysaccharide export outer membrane protein
MRACISSFARCVLVAAFAATTLAARALPADPQPAAASCMAAYVIGPEDVLEIAVWNNTNITRTVPVRPDGRISLPLLDDVQAAGLTPAQLREKLTGALTPYIPAPSVSVIVREIHSFKVTVMGQVKTPGRYELKGRATVLDLLAMAGGFTEFASRGRIVVLRQEGAETVRLRFRYENLATDDGGKAGRPDPVQENFCVKPGDIILVP